MCVTIEGDRLTLYVIDSPGGDGVEVPMSYCAVSAYTRNNDAASVTIALDMDARRLYLDECVSSSGPRYVIIPIRNISEDTSQKDHLLCHCANADLCISALHVISAIENLNDEYLSTHGDDPSVIRNVSMTMCRTARAKGIIGKRRAVFRVPMPTD